MNDEEAKKILALFRPGTADRSDPSFDEALERTKPQPPQEQGQGKPGSGLAGWFQEHRSSYLSIRAKFQKIPVPPALKDRILAECKTPATTIIPFRPAIFLRAAAVLALCLGLAALFWPSHGREDDFNTYRTRMARTALQPYGMEMQSQDLQSIKAYFGAHKAPVDYVLPDGVTKAQLVGCTVTHWQGQPVSMLCFRTGQPLAAGAQSDLWLFVIDQASVRNGPTARSPIVTQVKKLMTATWNRDGKLYILAAAGDEEFLRKYL
jgi:hypothetical protein